MDICFHYFAVKSVARAAGYKEEQAQRIAEFSQFIDDYNWYAYFRATNIPNYIKSSDLDIVFNQMLSVINPVTTGFSDWIDLATLVLPRSQKFTVAPFHFIPQDKSSCDKGDYRAVPASLNDNSYISNMLKELQTEIHSSVLSEDDYLMKMGMLLHTFADTYAHQLFTGYNNQSNSVKLLSATNNINGQDVTEQYRFWIDKWTSKIESILGTTMPTIGHMAIVHIPDLTHLSFSMEYKSLDGQKYTHTRSNTSTFLNTCNQLYQYFRDCLGDGIPADMNWDDLALQLADGFLIDASKELNESEQAAVKLLIPHWTSIFPNYNYHYDSDGIKGRFILQTVKDNAQEPVTLTIEGKEVTLLGKAYSDEFYKYNFFADKHLIGLYGIHPRNFLSETEMPYNNIENAIKA